MKPSLKNRLRVRRRAALLEKLESRRLLAAVSPPAFLQWFDSSFDTVEQRTPDVFQAGYGAVWLPPPGRADSGDQSVGYDAYDRFDLGSPDHETLYGTETGLKSVATAFERAGVSLQIDAILNHSGFSDQGTVGFVDSGGYPGLAITLLDAIDGDFHSAFESGDLNGRLSGLVDIDHTTNHQFIRHPVDPTDASNIPPGSTADLSGRLANVPTSDNARFYPDRDGDVMFLFDPVTNESNIPVYSFDADCSSCGDATAENAMGYLMRYMQWMVQDVGVDGFRIDAAQHFEGFVMDYLDRALYRSNPRPLLDGSTDHVFSYSEVFTGDKNTLLSYVKKNIDPADPGRIGGNRDSLDFSTFFAMRDNLSSMGTSNAWQNIRDSMLDVHDDGLHNGSAGVLFVRSHDEFGPASLDNLGHAFALMHPGNAVVYMNGKEFGDGRDFPKPGRGDALGGVYGDTISNLVAIRNSHGRGDMLERWINNDGIYVFERDGSAVVGLSNRGDSGFDERTVNVNFAPGTHLIELTGNASDPAIDPNDDIQQVLTVSQGGTITMRIPRNLNANGEFHGKGYVIYGLPAPQAASGLELTGVDSVLPGAVPSATDYENGRTRLSDLLVVTGDSLQVKLQTEEVNLLGLSSLRDVFADGDNALLRLDGGIDVNGNGAVDFVTPGLVSYGFEQFVDKSSPRVGPGGLGEAGGDGEFLQTIDTSLLTEGTHFLEVRAFRHRTDGGPAIFSEFKESIYVDRLPPESEILSFEPYQTGINENRDLVVRSVDQTADNAHVFLNLPAGLTDVEVLQMVAGENQARKRDRDQFIYGFLNVPHGNNVATIVSYESTGNVNVQRMPGLFTSTIIGAGLGDLDFDGDVDLNDTQEFETVFMSENLLFNPAADFNADGQIDYADLDLFSIQQASAGADQAILDAIEATRALKFGAVADSYSLSEDETYTQAAPGVLANDRDPGPGANFAISTPGSISSDEGVTVTLAADGSFSYPSAGVFGSLTAQQIGTDFFTYSVTDGLTHASQATVTMTVQGINDPPTLAAISDITLDEDAAEQVVGLTQIGAGAGESQELLVSAVSDSPGLIPQPEIQYTSPNATGSLKFTPVANESGIAEIVVTVADGGLDGDLSTHGDNATLNRTIFVAVNAVNDLPTLNVVSVWNMDEDADEQVIGLSGASAGGGEVQPLRITATSDNPGLIPDPTVIYTDGASTGTLQLTPVADQSGTAEVVVTIEDGGLDGDLSTHGDNATLNRTIFVAVNAVNDLPTLNVVSVWNMDEDADEQVIGLSGASAGGGEVQPLRITATSDNPGLIPDPTVIYTDGASTGTLQLTPVADQSGTAEVVVTIEDGGLDGDLSTHGDNATLNRTIFVAVNAVNDLPTLNVVSVWNMDEDADEQVIGLSGASAGGGEVQPLRITATSDNPGLIPDPTVIYTDGASTGTLQLTPVADQSGTAEVVVTIEDGGLDGDLSTHGDNATLNRTIFVAVNAVNDLPTLNVVSVWNMDEDADEQVIGLSGASAGGGEVQPLRITATSDNPGLIPDPTVIYTDGASTGTLQLTPVADQSGTAEVVVTIEDGGLDGDLSTHGDNATLNRTIFVAVNAVNDLPTLNVVSVWNMDEDADEQVIGLSGASAGGGEVQPLRITATSDNPGLIPDPTVIYTDGASTGTLQLTPVADQSGTAEVVVTIEDGGLDGDLSTHGDNATLNRTIFVAVNAVNDLPTLNVVSVWNMDEDADEQVIGLSGASAGGGEVQPLRITATSDNPGLIPDPTVIYTDGASTGTLQLTPVADQSGTAEVVVTIEDGGLDGDLSTHGDNATLNRTIFVAVNAVNDVPTLNPLNALGLDENADEQMITLTGISSGGGEGQLVRVTTSLDSPGLLSEPVISYSEGADSGTLTFTPLIGQVGTAKITVHLEDSGPDGIFSNDEDNAFASYDLRVGVGVTSFTFDSGKVELRLREPDQDVLFRETMNGFSLELSPGIWFGVDTGGVVGGDSSLLTFDVSAGVPLIELTTGLSNSLSFDEVSNWRMGDVVNDSEKFLRSVHTVNDPSCLIYLDSANAWQNAVEPSDITNDGVVSVLDALVAINELARGAVTDLLTGQLDNPLDLVDWPGYYYDENGDGRLSTLDALRVLNVLALIQGDEGEGEALLTISGQRNLSLDLKEYVTPTLDGDVDASSGQVAAFGVVSASFVQHPVTIDSREAMDLDRLQAVDAAMVNLLHEISWLQ